jgi:hypothetical protein
MLCIRVHYVFVHNKLQVHEAGGGLEDAIHALTRAKHIQRSLLDR